MSDTTILDDWNCSDDDENDEEMNKTIFSLMSKRKNEIDSQQKSEQKKNILKKLSEIPNFNFSVITEETNVEETEEDDNQETNDEEETQENEKPHEEDSQLEENEEEEQNEEESEEESEEEEEENDVIYQKLQNIENELSEIKKFYAN